MKKIAIFWIATILFLHAETIEKEGKIEAVTLYRGQALVKRAIDVGVAEGSHKLIVKNLPTSIQVTSLFANASTGINIRSVRYNTRITAEFSQESFRKLNEELQNLEKEIRRNKSQKNFVRQQEQYLTELRNFNTNATKNQLHKGSLDPKTLMQMVSYIFQEGKRLSEEKLKLEEELLQLKEKQQFVNKKKRELSGQDSKEVREAIIYFDKKDIAQNSQIYLGYLVNNATWSPSYNVRAKSDQGKLTLEYNALVQQTSGENWDNVNLTLSTASVGMSADAPSLSLMTLDLQNDSSYANKNAVSEQYFTFKNKQAQLLKNRRKMEREEQLKANSELNKITNNLQIIEFASPRAFRRQRIRGQSILTVHYDITGQVNIHSRNNQQMVEIKKLQLTKELYNIAVPLLSEYIYRKAKIINSYDVALLEGKANIYLDGQFVGHAFIPITAKGQKFTLGFGIDTQLRAKRELINRKELVQRGNKVITAKYRLSFDNFKDKKVAVRVYDRMPKSNENLNVIFTSDVALSSDKRYQKISKNHGILRWDIEIPNESETQAPYSLEYLIQLEFEKGMSIITQNIVPQFQHSPSRSQKKRGRKSSYQSYNEAADMLDEESFADDFEDLDNQDN